MKNQNIRTAVIKYQVPLLCTFSAVIGISTAYLYSKTVIPPVMPPKTIEKASPNTLQGEYELKESIVRANFDKNLFDTVKKHEGYSLTVYNDSLGKPTICVGHLIKPDEDFSKGATNAQCEQIFGEDIATAKTKAMTLKAYQNQPVNVQQFLIEFTFQVGVKGIDKFKGLLKAIETKNYPEARIRLAKSLFARQMITANKGRLSFNERASDYSDQLSWQGTDNFMGQNFYFEVTRTKVCKIARQKNHQELFDDCESAFN